MSAREWIPREPPLPPRVVVAEADAAFRLVDRLLRWTDDALTRVEGVAAAPTADPRQLIALRASVDLPWADGVRYFGEAAEAPGVYLPTVRRPSGPIELLTAALRRQAPPGPIVWMPDGRIVPLASARPLDRETLTAWRTP